MIDVNDCMCENREVEFFSGLSLVTESVTVWVCVSVWICSYHRTANELQPMYMCSSRAAAVPSARPSCVGTLPSGERSPGRGTHASFVVSLRSPRHA